MKISKTVTLLVLGATAYAIYKFNQMTDEEKDALKAKGKKIFDEHISPLVAGMLGITEDPELVEQKGPVK